MKGSGKRVLASGAFEILHPGHIKFLAEAKKIGGEGSKLIVVIARDETIKERKRREPIMDEESRKEIISALKLVDEVILGHAPFSFEEVIEEVKPDIVVFGHDQDELMNQFKKFAKEHKLKVEIVKVQKFSSNFSSTTEIVERIKRIFFMDKNRL